MSKQSILDRVGIEKQRIISMNEPGADKKILGHNKKLSSSQRDLRINNNFKFEENGIEEMKQSLISD